MDDNISGPITAFDMKEFYFFIEFPTCNSFRQVLEFLNQSHKTIPLCFSKNKFSIRKPNDRQTIIFDGVFNARNFLFYHVDHDELEKKRREIATSNSPNREPEFFIHVPILPLLVNLKRVQKKGHIRLAQKKGKEGFVEIASEEAGSGSSIRIDPSKEDPITLESETPISSDNPNTTMQLSGFHYSATGCGRISDRVSKIQVYNHGVKILSNSAQGDSDVKKGDYRGEVICEVTLPGDMMKSISKLASLCDEGIVRVYSSDDSHIRLEIPISVMGTASIFLMADDGFSN